MSKISDALLHEQDIKMEYYGKFMDHIYDVLHPEPRLSEDDISAMEQEAATSNIPKPLNFKSTASVSQGTANNTEITRKIA